MPSTPNPLQWAGGPSPFDGLGHSKDLILIILPIYNLQQTLESPASIRGLNFYILYKHTFLRFT